MAVEMLTTGMLVETEGTGVSVMALVIPRVPDEITSAERIGATELATTVMELEPDTDDALEELKALKATEELLEALEVVLMLATWRLCCGGRICPLAFADADAEDDPGCVAVELALLPLTLTLVTPAELAVELATELVIGTELVITVLLTTLDIELSPAGSGVPRKRRDLSAYAMYLVTLAKSARR